MRFVKKIGPPDDVGKFSRGIFIELQKAFVTVDHSILLGNFIFMALEVLVSNFFLGC